jgi:hypothetical protein
VNCRELFHAPVQIQFNHQPDFWLSLHHRRVGTIKCGFHCGSQLEFQPNDSILDVTGSADSTSFRIIWRTRNSVTAKNCNPRQLDIEGKAYRFMRSLTDDIVSVKDVKANTSRTLLVYLIHTYIVRRAQINITTLVMNRTKPTRRRCVANLYLSTQFAVPCRAMQNSDPVRPPTFDFNSSIFIRRAGTTAYYCGSQLEFQPMISAISRGPGSRKVWTYILQLTHGSIPSKSILAF